MKSTALTEDIFQEFCFSVSILQQLAVNVKKALLAKWFSYSMY